MNDEAMARRNSGSLILHRAGIRINIDLQFA
jgi:hypothetical protein